MQSFAMIDALPNTHAKGLNIKLGFHYGLYHFADSLISGPWLPALPKFVSIFKIFVTIYYSWRLY